MNNPHHKSDTWYYVCRDVPDDYIPKVLQERYPVGDVPDDNNAEVWHYLSMQWNPIMIAKTQSINEVHVHYFDDWVYMHIPTQRPFVFHYIRDYEYDILDAFGIPQLGKFNESYTFSPCWLPGTWKLDSNGVAIKRRQ